MSEKRIPIITGRARTHDGREFITYKAVKSDGRTIDCRFRKEINVPEDVSAVIVEPGEFNIDTARRYPVLWIKDVVRFELNADRVPNSYDDLFEDA